MAALLGIGVDACAHSRVEALQAKWGAKFSERILTTSEQQQNLTPRYLAGTFALKEAVAKALGTGIGETLSFQDISIERMPNTAPKIHLSTSVVSKLGVGAIHASLTHENGVSIAFVQVEKA